jgi:uncharacterized protein YeaO (DUF488 family)
MIRTKSVNSAIDRKKDGLRILVTRIRGRGLRKSRYHEWRILGRAKGFSRDIDPRP